MKKSFFVFMLTVSFSSYSCESKTFGFNPNADNTGDLVAEESNAFLPQTEKPENKASDEPEELCPTHGMEGSYLKDSCYSCNMPRVGNFVDQDSSNGQPETMDLSTESFVVVEAPKEDPAS